MLYWEELVEGKTVLVKVNFKNDDKKNSKKLTVLTKSGVLSKQFLKYAKDEVGSKLNKQRITPGEVTNALSVLIDSDIQFILGQRESNVVDPLVKRLVTYFEGEKDIDEIKTTLFEAGESRTQWHPQAKKGEATGEPKRLQTTGLGERKLSFAEGMLHLPQFVEGGKNATNYTLINGNSTYSIGGYQIERGKPVHLLGGSTSGETFNKGEPGMHAEEQQFLALRDQIRANSHGIADQLAKGPVVMHLFISKSPCSERCQGQIRQLLKDYPNLQIQMYLEIPYKSNDPESMREEARHLNNLMEEKDIKGRLAYQVISTEAALNEKNTTDGPLQRWGSKGDLMFEGIGGHNRNMDLAVKRKGNFAELVNDGHLNSASYVNALQQLGKTTVNKPVTIAEDNENGESDTEEVSVEDGHQHNSTHSVQKRKGDDFSTQEKKKVKIKHDSD